MMLGINNRRQTCSIPSNTYIHDMHNIRYKNVKQELLHKLSMIHHLSSLEPLVLVYPMPHAQLAVSHDVSLLNNGLFIRYDLMTKPSTRTDKYTNIHRARVCWQVIGHRLVAGTYKSSGHDHQLISTVQQAHYWYGVQGMPDDHTVPGSAEAQGIITCAVGQLMSRGAGHAR